jgi:hypothetical protein
MSYIISNNQKGQNNNANSSPVTVSSDQIGNNQLATDESLVLLRRIVKLLESNAVVDSSNRQRVSIDTSPAQLTATINGFTATIPSIANMDHKQFIDIARNAYANGIRSKLDFS